MKKKIQTKNTKGFMLIFVVLMVSIITIVGGITFNSVLNESKISRDEGNSLMAFYAADTGIECVRFLQNNYSAFDTMSNVTTYNCGVGANFTAGLCPLGNDCSADDCIAHTYNITLDPFSNGACANINVEVIPTTIFIMGNPRVVCRASVSSTGKNSCSMAGAGLVERTRWEEM